MEAKDVAQVSGHSVRVGATQDLLALNIDLAPVMQAGRWKSNRMPHLLIEETLDTIIAKYVFHPEFLAAAKLRFAQKLNIARAASLGEQANEMWELGIAFNSVRNELSHTLLTEKREKKIEALRTIYFKLMRDGDGKLKDPALPDQVVIYWSIAMFLGFLEAHLAEVERFRQVVDEVDKIFNPHRHVVTAEAGQSPDIDT
jgi:hypothetical protein